MFLVCRVRIKATLNIYGYCDGHNDEKYSWAEQDSNIHLVCRWLAKMEISLSS